MRGTGAVALPLARAGDELADAGGAELIADEDRPGAEEDALDVGRDGVVARVLAGALDTVTVRTGRPVPGWCACAEWAVQPAVSSNAAAVVRVTSMDIDGHPFDWASGAS